MDHLFGKSGARGDGGGSARQCEERIAAVALLFVMMGAVGCIGDQASDEEESIASAAQEAIRPGENGIPPEVLNGYLNRESTDATGVTSPLNANVTNLCASYQGMQCKLKTSWAKWLNPNGVVPPDPDTVLRYHLVATMIQCATVPEFTVSVPAFGLVRGMFALLPKWTKDPIGQAEQDLVSACILAKVNNYEVPVPIGVVGPGPGPEAPLPIGNLQFTHQQAAFAGRVFGDSTSTVACTGAGGELAVGQELRDCHKPGNQCLISGLGPCAAVCGGWGNIGIPTGEFCKSIKDPQGAVYSYPLTVYLLVK